MQGYFSILRSSVCILSAFAILVGSIVAGTIAIPLYVLYAIIASFLITGAGNVINDIFDVKMRERNIKRRGFGEKWRAEIALSRGELPRRSLMRNFLECGKTLFTK